MDCPLRARNVPAGGNPFYYVEDMLGSSRIVAQNNGVVCYDADFYPYGGERPVTNTCPQNYKFEGKERDTETGNDDFGARYYSSRLVQRPRSRPVCESKQSANAQSLCHGFRRPRILCRP